jgi:hypothetical protein
VFILLIGVFSLGGHSSVRRNDATSSKHSGYNNLSRLKMKKQFSLACKSILASFALLQMVATANAQPATAPAVSAPVYAVLSLIGDKLNIVIAQLQTGTRLDINQRDSIDIDNAVFDNAAVSAVAAAVRKIDPKAELAAINTRSAVLFEKQRTLFAQSGDTISMPGAIRDALKAQSATHLFLITKRRDDANAQFTDGSSDGKGRLEGLGFYLDGSMQTKVSQTGASGRGFVAPYVYIDVALIEVASSRVIKKEKITVSNPVSGGAAEKDIGNPWAALSSSEKVRLVDFLVRREIERGA